MLQSYCSQKATVLGASAPRFVLWAAIYGRQEYSPFYAPSMWAPSAFFEFFIHHFFAQKNSPRLQTALRLVVEFWNQSNFHFRNDNWY